MTSTRVHDAEEILGAFAAALRAAGVPVTMDRTQAFLRAASIVDMSDQVGVYWAGRATLCGEHDDLERYDKLFTAWFNGEGLHPLQPRDPSVRVPQADVEGEGDGSGGELDEIVVRAAASTTEVLRHRDIAAMTPGERAALARLFASLHPRPPLRLSSRRRACG
jgi:uncharacterized protein with von Willebrand factor type A (vWA) domain